MYQVEYVGCRRYSEGKIYTQYNPIVIGGLFERPDV